MRTSRLKGNTNLLVVIGSVALFVIALLVLTAMAGSNRPPQEKVLAAARDLAPGDVLQAGDLTQIGVYKDDASDRYIPAGELQQTVGGVVALPLAKGDPILRSALVADVNGDRVSALLTRFPAGTSLFPLPLNRQNVVAPPVASIQVGDLVGITLTIASQPQEPTSMAPAETAMPEASVTPTPTPAGLSAAFPPFAKDLFPQGVRVIAVQGGSKTQPTPSAALTSANQTAPLLLLLVPADSREELSLALQGGDLLVVSLLAKGGKAPSPGFSYWDLQQLFELDRQAWLAQQLTPTAPPTPTGQPAAAAQLSPTPGAGG
jgi:hypothetical protein